MQELKNFCFSPFLWIVALAFAAAILFYLLFLKIGSLAGVVIATTLFAQTHFVMSYLFSWYNVRRRLYDSFFGTIIVYFLFVGVTSFFYSPLAAFSATFWGFMAIAAYFLLHFYENILQMWEASGPKFIAAPAENGRKIFYFLIASVSFFIYLGLAAKYGARFRLVGISFNGIPAFAYILVLIFIGSILLYLWRQKEEQRNIFSFCFWAALTVLLLLSIGSSYLTFFGLIYFTTIWHFFTWHFYYLWRTWQKYHSLSLLPQASDSRPQQKFSKLLAYSTSGPLPFTLASLTVAIPLIAYFFLTYDGSRYEFLYNPVYGQFAMFVWSIPHTTLTFIPWKNYAG